MQKMGLEPTRYCYHRHLKPARLPIPPLLHVELKKAIVSFLPLFVNHKFKIFTKKFIKIVLLCRSKCKTVLCKKALECIFAVIISIETEKPQV